MLRPQKVPGHCVREGCPANDGGACALGIDPVLDCEEYQLVGDEKEEGEPASASNVYRFHSGEALLPTELDRVLAGLRPSIIVPLGEIEAGKTTLIALMYQRLCSRTMDRWRYSGSATSVGFTASLVPRIDQIETSHTDDTEDLTCGERPLPPFGRQVGADGPNAPTPAGRRVG